MALTLYQPWLHTARCTVVSIQLLSWRMSYHSPLDLSFGEGLGSSIYLYSSAGQWEEGVNICVNPYPTPSSYVEANLQGEGIQRWCVCEVIRWKVEPSWTRSYKRGPGENACPFSHVKTQQEGTKCDTASNHPETLTGLATSIISASGTEEQISVVFEIRECKYLVIAACMKIASPFFFLFATDWFAMETTDEVSDE